MRVVSEMTDSDAHHGPHRIARVEPLPGTGLCLLVRQHELGLHQEIVLAATKEGGPDEALDCLVDDEPVDADEWGWNTEVVTTVIRHVVQHVIESLPPGGCDD